MYTYEEAEEYILSIPKFAGKNTLEDTHILLDRVYREGSAKIIHVAGTNGKGSTSAYIYGVLRKAGISAGLFTSPHLTVMTERIEADDERISRNDFLKSFERVLEITEEEKNRVSHPSFFEFLFLMAMHFFAEKKVSYIVLETGLGGRLDATNCINKKSLSVITNIDYDHTEYLGSTLSQIAAEKAGIISENTPVVFLDNKEEASGVIRKRATELNSACYGVKPSDIAVSFEKLNNSVIDFSLRCDYYKLDKLQAATSARYQILNGALAAVAAHMLSDNRITDDIIREGLLKKPPLGRFTEIKNNVFMDGAHNPDGIRAFLDTVAESPIKNRILLFGVLKDKDYPEMIRLVSKSGLFEKIYVTAIDNKRTLDRASYEAEFSKYGVYAGYFEDAETAYRTIISEKKDEEIFYIAGSLYLLGQLLTLEELKNAGF